MGLIDSKILLEKIILALPIILCLLGIYGVDKTNGNILAGFNDLPQEQKDRLIKRGYLSKTKKMILVMCVPLGVTFLCSFFIHDRQLFEAIYYIDWFIFIIITIAGGVMVHKSTKR